MIDSRGLTAYAVAKLAGVDPGVVARFMSGLRDIRLETADRLAGALGLRLVEVGRRPAPKASRAVATVDPGYRVYQTGDVAETVEPAI